MDKIIVLSGEDYIVFRELDVDNKHYIYTVALDSDKYTLLEEKTIDEEQIVESVTNRD